MGDDLLLRLLRAGLLEALGDDDQRRKRAEAAATATGEWLRSSGRPHFGAAIIRAIDETSNISGAAIEYAEERLLEEWPTLRNVYPERPNELLRAIVLQGAVLALEADPDLAAAAWYTTRTARDLSISAGRWVEVVNGVVGEVDDAVCGRLNQEWAPTMPDSKLVMPKLELNDTELPDTMSTEQLRTALEPYVTNLEGNYQQVSAALGKHVPPVLDGLVTANEAIIACVGKTGAMKTFSAALGRDLRSLLAQQATMIEAMRLRETLLWWRLAGHSNALSQRYSEVEDRAACALAAAADLHQLCPSLAPEAVEHLLADVVSQAARSGGEHSPEDVAKAWAEVSPRIGLSHTVGLLIGSEPPTSVRKLTTAELAVIAFRDLQTARLTVAPVEPESDS